MKDNFMVPAYTATKMTSYD